MKKKIVLFILFTLLLFTTVFAIINANNIDAIGVKEFQQLEQAEQQGKFKILGNIHSISQDSFSIVDLEFPETRITYEFKPNSFSFSNYAIGETVIIEVENMFIIEVEKFEFNRAERYLENHKPLIKPKIIKHDPNDEIFKIELENIGSKIITHENISDENFGYYLLYKLNDDLYTFHPSTDFDYIFPAQSIVIEFPFDRNILYKMKAGINSISFAWGQKSLYDEDFEILLESKPVEIFLRDSINN